MILTADVYAAFEALWNQSAAAKLVPGGLWEGRPRQAAGGTVSPAAPGTPGLYAVLEVAEGEPLWTSGPAYVVTFTATLTVWSTAGAQAAGTVQAALWAVLHRDRANNLVVRNARTVDARPLAGSLKKDGPKKDARDVLAAQQRWEVTLSGTV